MAKKQCNDLCLQVQAYLILKDYNDGDHLIGDGVWGKHSKTALACYQQDYGLAPTGEIDRETLDCMEKDCATGLPENTTWKQLQAALILDSNAEEDTYDAEFVADGNPGDHTLAMIVSCFNRGSILSDCLYPDIELFKE